MATPAPFAERGPASSLISLPHRLIGSGASRDPDGSKHKSSSLAGATGLPLQA